MLSIEEYIEKYGSEYSGYFRNSRQEVIQMGMLKFNKETACMLAGCFP